MTEDEMKNKISLALKDLQQGFEIICKENAGLKARLNAINSITLELERASKERRQQFTKAKEIIKNLIDSLETIDGEQVRELEVVKEAEQFLEEVKE